MDETNNSKISNIGIIVVAAGGSSRMLNEPKQLLQFQGVTLLRRAVETALASDGQIVVVVLGAHFYETSGEIKDLPVRICFNENWQDGLSSSIKLGLKILLEIAPKLAAAVITLGDQPFITAEKINLLINRFRETKKMLIAAQYATTIGVPALFSTELFAELGEIEGDKGAKELIEKHLSSAETVFLPEAAFDVDTPADFTRIGEISGSGQNRLR